MKLEWTPRIFTVLHYCSADDFGHKDRVIIRARQNPMPVRSPGHQEYSPWLNQNKNRGSTKTRRVVTGFPSKVLSGFLESRSNSTFGGFPVNGNVSDHLKNSAQKLPSSGFHWNHRHFRRVETSKYAFRNPDGIGARKTERPRGTPQRRVCQNLWACRRLWKELAKPVITWRGSPAARHGTPRARVPFPRAPCFWYPPTN